MIGVVAEHAAMQFRIGARKGVVLACGGFEWNNELVRAHIGYDVHPLSPPVNNTGDGMYDPEAVEFPNAAPGYLIFDRTAWDI